MIIEPGGNESATEQQHRVEAIVAQGPGGSFAVAGAALAVVMAVWLAFYVLVFLARGGA